MLLELWYIRRLNYEPTTIWTQGTSELNVNLTKHSSFFKKKALKLLTKKNYRAKYIARIFRNKHQLNLGPAWNMKISH